MRCIFCLEEKEPTNEHIFPSAIGGTLTIDRVCKQCNDWLGANIDVLLTDHDLILLERAKMGMRNRAGNVINPWKDVFRNGVMADDSEQRVRIVSDPKTGRPTPKILYKTAKKTLGNGGEIVQITMDAQEIDQLEKVVQRYRRRAGLEPLSNDEIQALIETAKTNIRSIHQPEVKHSLKIDIMDYKRAILKIAYELAWLWLGDKYLNDPVAEQLRNSILKDEDMDGIKGRIELGGNMAPLSIWCGEPNAHIGLCSRVGNNIAISVRIFTSICSIVHVSGTADRYAMTDRSIDEGRFTLIDLQGFSRNTSLNKELSRLSRHPS